MYDIGANVGFYTLLAAKLAGPAGHVYAFEPAPRNFDFLRRHVTMNAISNVTLMQAAICSEAGQAMFDLGKSFETGRLSRNGEVMVRVETIDQLVFEHSMPPPHVIKIDVEGHEAEVLGGARETLKRYRPIVFVATHRADVHQQCCAAFDDHRYIVSSVDERSVAVSDELIAHPA